MRRPAFALLLLAACKDPQPPASQQPPEPAPVAVRLGDLAKVTETNPVALLVQFGGKPLDFEGAYLGVEAAPNGRSRVLVLDEITAICSFGPDRQAEVARLPYHGGSLGLRGWLEKGDARGLFFSRCAITKYPATDTP